MAALPTRKSVLRQAWPIILANATVPIVGLTDTAVIGNLGSVVGLGAVAVGALVFTFVYWGFGFLRMATTGFVAQAVGSGDEAEVRATLGRGLVLAIALGVGLFALQGPIAAVGFGLLSASSAVEASAAEYFALRIWGAPATLANFALMGVLIGLGKSRHVLLLQLLSCGSNAGLDVLFAGVLGWGVRGIALGTALSEWAACGVGLLQVRALLRHRHQDSEPFWPWSRIVHAQGLRKQSSASLDIMIRTLLLVGGFAWFTDQSARFSDPVLAGNHVLLQLLSFSAFFLDGYAFVAEALVGAALGAGNRARFDAAVFRSTELAAVTALLLAAGILWGGESAIAALTDLDSVRRAAAGQIPMAALYVLCAFPAFQLDGIFIGATRTREMRNASLQSLLVFLVASWWLVPAYENRGLWLAFVLYVAARAATLLVQFGALRRGVTR